MSGRRSMMKIGIILALLAASAYAASMQDNRDFDEELEVLVLERLLELEDTDNKLKVDARDIQKPVKSGWLSIIGATDSEKCLSVDSDNVNLAECQVEYFKVQDSQLRSFPSGDCFDTSGCQADITRTDCTSLTNGLWDVKTETVHNFFFQIVDRNSGCCITRVTEGDEESGIELLPCEDADYNSDGVWWTTKQWWYARPYQLNGLSYMGCYRDCGGSDPSGNGGVGRDLPNDKKTTSNAMTIEKCAGMCAGYTYLGVQIGFQCFCGDDFGTTSALNNYEFFLHPDSECNVKCKGNSAQICGRSCGNSVYAKDVDVCASGEHTCDAQATCINTADTGDTVYCLCNQGLTGDGHSCTDINECDLLNDCLETELCVNTPGSYRCLNILACLESQP